jgi:hypothetical protein
MAFLATYILERLLLIGVKIFRIGMWCIEFPAADRWYTNDALNSQFFTVIPKSKLQLVTIRIQLACYQKNQNSTAGLREKPRISFQNLYSKLQDIQITMPVIKLEPAEFTGCMC